MERKRNREEVEEREAKRSQRERIHSEEHVRTVNLLMLSRQKNEVEKGELAEEVLKYVQKPYW